MKIINESLRNIVTITYFIQLSLSLGSGNAFAGPPILPPYKPPTKPYTPPVCTFPNCFPVQPKPRQERAECAQLRQDFEGIQVKQYPSTVCDDNLECYNSATTDESKCPNAVERGKVVVDANYKLSLCQQLNAWQCNNSPDCRTWSAIIAGTYKTRTYCTALYADQIQNPYGDCKAYRDSIKLTLDYVNKTLDSLPNKCTPLPQDTNQNSCIHYLNYKNSLVYLLNLSDSDLCRSWNKPKP